MWWKQNKRKVIVPLLIAAVLAAAFYYGGGAPGLQGWHVDRDTSDPALSGGTPSSIPESSAFSDAGGESGAADAAESGRSADLPGGPAGKTDTPTDGPAPAGAEAEELPSAENMPAQAAKDGKTADDGGGTEEPSAAENTPSSRPGGTDGGMSADEKLAAAAQLANVSSPDVEEGDADYSESLGMTIDPDTGKDRYLTDPVPEGRPVPVEPQDTAITDTAHTCTISISCATILDNMDWLDPEKTELVPEGGWILTPTEVTFYEGENVFNVLQRTCRQNSIHMEFKDTPMYNSAYIEGIHNLYEFDCGELSGWMYSVNDWFPNYGCSRYQLSEGDVIEWVYTCNLGIDVGGYSAAAG